MQAAGTSSGASLTACSARSAASSGSPASRSPAIAVSSTARWRRALALSIRPRDERRSMVSSAAPQSPSALCASSSGVVGPGDARGEAGGLGRVGAGGGLVLAAAGLHEQPAQAQHPRLRIVDHALERALGRVPVAGDLRRLRLEQQGQRLGAEEPLGIARRSAGRPGDRPSRPRPCRGRGPRGPWPGGARRSRGPAPRAGRSGRARSPRAGPGRSPRRSTPTRATARLVPT